MVARDRATGSRVRRAYSPLVAGAALSHSRGRTRSDGLRVRAHLGLGRSLARRGDARPAVERGAAFLCGRPQLPDRLRALRARLLVALPGGGRLHAPRARSRAILTLAVAGTAGDSTRWQRAVAGSWHRDQSR